MVGFSLCNVRSLHSGLLEIPILVAFNLAIEPFVEVDSKL